MHTYMKEDGEGGFRPVVILENSEENRVVAIEEATETDTTDTVIAKVIGTNHFVAE